MPKALGSSRHRSRALGHFLGIMNRNTFFFCPRQAENLAHLTHRISTKCSESQEGSLGSAASPIVRKGEPLPWLEGAFATETPGCPTINTAGRQRKPQQVAGCQPTGHPLSRDQNLWVCRVGGDLLFGKDGSQCGRTGEETGG